MRLDEMVFTITGATGGLGSVVTKRLASIGARLVLISSSAEKLAILEREANLSQDQVLSIAINLTQPEAAGRVLEGAIARFQRIDVLLHFIGGWIGGKSVAQVTAEDVSTMLQQHLWTTFYLAQSIGPHFINNGRGRFIVISSPSVGTPPANNAPYTIGKSAQEALMLTLAEEFKGTGATANIIRVRTIDVKHERENQPSLKKSLWTTPEEIAATILFLCSDDAGMINGARIPLYGGQ